jgi:O-antigen/teichoic acid export membrane protein
MGYTVLKMTQAKKSLKLLKDIIIYGASSVISKLLGILLLPFYTRIFSVGDYGVMDILSVTCTFLLLLFSFQIDQGFAFYFASRRSDGEKKAYTSTGFLFYILIFGLVSVLICLFSLHISKLLFNTSSFGLTVKSMAVYLFIYSLKYFLINVLKWKNKAKAFAGLSILETFLGFVFVVLLVGKFKMGLPGVYYAGALNAAIIGVLSFIFTIDLVGFKFLSVRRFYRMWNYSWPLIFSSLAIYILQFTDRFMITKLIGLESAGLYGMAFRLSNIVMVILSGFQVAWGPFIFANYRDKDTPEMIRKSFEKIFVISLLFLIGASLFSIEALIVMTTKPFWGAYQLVPFVTISIILFTLAGYFSFGLNISKKTKDIANINLMVAILNIALNFIGIKFFGLFGAVFATVVSFIILFFFLILRSQKYYFVAYRWRLYSILLILTLAPLSYLVFMMPLKISLTWIIIKCFFIAIISVLFFRFGLVNKEEVTLLLEKTKQKINLKKGGLK